MVMFQFRSLDGFASACLLLAACSAPSEPGALDPEGTSSAPVAPTPSSMDGSNPAPTLPSAPLGGSSDGAPVTSPTPSGSSESNPSVSLPPTSGSSDGSGAATPADEGDGAAPPPDPLTPGGGLIRGDAPTTESATNEGPFDVDIIGSGLRDGPQYGTQTLHVPVGAEPPFASVVVVPGFVSPESSIRAWGPFLASHGIVTLTIGTNGGGDPPAARALALLDGIETLRAENTRSGSPLEGHMALDRFGVMGWSMGGGGTLIAANENPELRAAVSFAAWSPGARFVDDAVPTLLLAGSSDTLAGGQSQGFFESIPEATPKMLFEVAGGSHSVANDPRSADGQIGRYGLSWLKVFLEGDERYRQFLLEEPSRASDFRDNL